MPNNHTCPVKSDLTRNHPRHSVRLNDARRGVIIGGKKNLRKKAAEKF